LPAVVARARQVRGGDRRLFLLPATTGRTPAHALSGRLARI
jgi:hypothetical protein